MQVFGVSVAFIFLNTTVNYDPALETRDWVGIALFGMYALPSVSLLSTR